ncbi:MAG TPA: ribonuclease Z [Nitrospirae bacterium]|nr:ribonuclease Z [Nitrospirota bacterium]
MKPTFHHFPVNGIFEDPVVYLRFLRQRRAFLFDAGDVSALSSRDINKITDLFVTHTHIDHFIGFDMILRQLLRRDTPLRVYGPEGIISAIKGKLQGYAWNVISEYPLQIMVHEVREDIILKVGFSAFNRFVPEAENETTFRGVILEEDDIKVKAAVVEHDIPVLAFSIEEDRHINIDKARLTERGLSVGPWLSDFKDALRKGHRDREFRLNNRLYRTVDLMDIAIITEGQKVSYVMDVSPVEDNIERIVELVKGSHTLYIESYFLQEDFPRALERRHLTAEIAGRIARDASVKEIVPLHISPKYRAFPERVLEEAQQAFRR